MTAITAQRTAENGVKQSIWSAAEASRLATYITEQSQTLLESKEQILNEEVYLSASCTTCGV